MSIHIQKDITEVPKVCVLYINEKDQWFFEDYEYTSETSAYRIGGKAIDKARFTRLKVSENSLEDIQKLLPLAAMKNIVHNHDSGKVESYIDYYVDSNSVMGFVLGYYIEGAFLKEKRIDQLARRCEREEEEWEELSLYKLESENYKDKYLRKDSEHEVLRVNYSNLNRDYKQLDTEFKNQSSKLSKLSSNSRVLMWSLHIAFLIIIILIFI